MLLTSWQPAGRISTFRGNVKKSVEALVPSTFRLTLGDTEKGQWLKKGLRFIFPHDYQVQSTDFVSWTPLLWHCSLSSVEGYCTRRQAVQRPDLCDDPSFQFLQAFQQLRQQDFGPVDLVVTGQTTRARNTRAYACACIDCGIVVHTCFMPVVH